MLLLQGVEPLMLGNETGRGLLVSCDAVQVIQGDGS
jgi:hypothetical protein